VWSSTVGWPNQAKIGDYYHMVSDNYGADLAWSATFNGGQDVYYTRIPRADLIAAGEPAPRFELYSGTPNPFRSSTTLRFDVPSSGGHARLEVYNVAGRRITTLENRWLAGGAHVARWDGTDATGRSVGPGLYFSRLQVDGASRTGRLLRLR